MTNPIDPIIIPGELPVDLGLDIFVNELVKQKPEFKELDADVLNAIKEDLKVRIESYVNISLLKYISEDKLDEFEKVIDTNDASQIQEFCKAYIPDLSNVVALILMNFKDTYLGTNNY